MDDKELLELAAKAAGLPKHAIDGDREAGVWPWNPLTDDGEALRLAVQLGITPFVRTGKASYWIDGEVWATRNPKSMDDPYASTRLAIVLAAAEIGKVVVTPNANGGKHEVRTLRQVTQSERICAVGSVRLSQDPR